MKYVASWAVCFVVLFGCERVERQDTPVPAAVVFAYNGQEIFVGNEQVEPNPNAQYPGTLHTMQKAFELASPAKELPVGSVGMLISYADKPTIRLPMGPIAKMTAEAFGTQQDYRGRIGNALVSAIELGVDELSKVPADRRILIVFGDGTDTDMKTASDRMHAIKPQLERAHIKAYLMGWGSDGPTPAGLGFYDAHRLMNSVEGLVHELQAVWRGDLKRL